MIYIYCNNCSDSSQQLNRDAYIIIIIIIMFIYLPSDVISQEKTATSSRSITKASKYAIPLKPTHKLAESKRYLVTL